MRKTIKEMFTEFAEYLFESGKAESTIDNYMSSALAFKNYCHDNDIEYLDELTVMKCIKFVKRRERAPDTVRAEMTRITFMLNRCVENKYLDSNPFKHSDVRSLKPRSKWRELYFNGEQLVIFFKAALKIVSVLHTQFFFLLSETGLRSSEGRHLRYCDIHMDDKSEYSIRVEPRLGWKPKTERSVRSIPLTADAKNLLLELRKYHCGDPTDLIFPMSWTNRSLSYEFNKVLKHLDWHHRNHRGEKFVVHSLRHTFATRLSNEVARKRLPMAVIRDILGHAYLLDRYIHTSEPQIYEAMREL